MVNARVEFRSRNKERFMNCSHGLAYEVKCSMCYSEAMARVMQVAKTEPGKIPEDKGVSAGSVEGVQKEFARIQELS